MNNKIKMIIETYYICVDAAAVYLKLAPFLCHLRAFYIEYLAVKIDCDDIDSFRFVHAHTSAFFPFKLHNK